MNFETCCSNEGMTRRHFLAHLAGASAMALPAAAFAQSLRSGAAQLKKRHKAAILLWMGGGPSTIDLWDMKPGSATGGPFKAIATSGNEQICEHLPMLAKQMHHLAIVRSMSTREADHDRARYYLHTGFVPNPSVEHPGYGSVVSRMLEEQSRQLNLEVPPFVAVGGSSVGPGFLGMTYAPFVVNSNGRVDNLRASVPADRLAARMRMLGTIEQGFIQQNRGQSAKDHADVLSKTVGLLSSEQMAAFQIDQEPQNVRDRYGNTQLGRGALMARRLVEQGVPFVEVDMGGWDTHQNNFQALSDTLLPQVDRATSALVEDLSERGLLGDTVVLWMGEFGRTPRINGSAGRDHWARSWSVVLGGGGIQGGIAIGRTSADGTEVETEPYTSQDLMATVCQTLGISLETTFKTPSGRPMKIANSGKVIPGLLT